MTTVTTAATYKTKITGDLPDFGLKDVDFQLVASFFNGAGEEVIAGKTYTMTLDASGNDDGAFYLPTPDNTGDAGANWRLTLPSGYLTTVTVAYSASAQSVQDLIAAGSTTTDPDTITAALASKASLVSGATADNLASLTSGGDLADSGVAKTAVGNATKLQARTLASTAPTDGQAVVWNDGAEQWEPGDIASDVGELTTTGLTAANYLRVAAAGGLEERTPAQVAAAVQSSLSVGTTQLVHNNSLLTGLAFCFPLGEPEGTRYDKVGAYELGDNNTVTQGAGVQGQAALFTAASTEYLSATSAAQYQITAAQTSITYWINHTNTALMCPISKFGGTANEYIIQNSTNNNVRVNTYGTPDTNLIHTATLLPGYWYFIHVYFDITNGLIGIQVNNGMAQTTAVTAINSSNSEFRIGQFNNARYMNGRLWQVCKWNRLLTALELTNLYNGGNGLLYPFS